MTLVAPEGDWIQTFTRQAFDVQNFREGHIRLEDIAHALSHICRFSGHTDEFYSVAQHALMVSYLCAPEDAKFGLLHDATEAYIGDLATPIKKLIPEYKQYEIDLWAVIARRFDLPVKSPASVKQADILALHWEANNLFARGPMFRWAPDPTSEQMQNVPKTLFTSLPPIAAKALFLERYTEVRDDHID